MPTTLTAKNCSHVDFLQRGVREVASALTVVLVVQVVVVRVVFAVVLCNAVGIARNTGEVPNLVRRPHRKRLVNNK